MLSLEVLTRTCRAFAFRARAFVVPLVILFPKMIGCANVTDVPYNLKVGGRALAIVGASVPLTVEAHSQWSAIYDSYGNGVCDLRVAKAVTAEVEDLRCEGVHCTVNRNDMTVSSDVEDTVTVQVGVKVSDGTRHTVPKLVRFAEPTAIDVLRSPHLDPAGTVLATVVGVPRDWTVAVRVGNEAAWASNLAVHSTGGVVIGLGEPREQRRLRVESQSPGTGHLIVSIRNLARDLTLRAVAPDDVRELSFLASDQLVLPFDRPAKPSGEEEVASLDVEAPSPDFRPVSTPIELQYCQSKGPAARYLALRAVDALGVVAVVDPVGFVTTSPTATIDRCWFETKHVGTVELDAVVGSASLSVPVVVAPCSDAVIGSDAGDASADGADGDGSSDAGDAGDADAGNAGDADAGDAGDADAAILRDASGD